MNNFIPFSQPDPIGLDQQMQILQIDNALSELLPEYHFNALLAFKT